MDDQLEPSKGFIYGVGQNPVYMAAAKFSAYTLRDHMPDAKITMVAPKRLIDKECEQLFDTVICDQYVPDSERTKLYALSKTPYDLTMYLDADTQIMSEEITTCFDQLGDKDILFTNIRLYNSNPKGVVDNVEYKYHGGVFLYNRKCIPMMAQWWDLYQQGQTEWPYTQYPRHLRVWDQFYLYYIMNYTKHGLNVGIFKDDARWNFVIGYLAAELKGKSEIIRHCTIKKATEDLFL